MAKPSRFMRVPRATIDFESRSPVDLRKFGSWRYSLDPRTEVLCLAFRLPHWEKGRTSLWHPEFPKLGIPEQIDMDDMAELIEWIERGYFIEAHNAWFERGLWKNKFAPLYGYPLIADDQWMCSAAKAASHALPRSLDGAIAALGLEEGKDLDGAKVMKKMAKPRKPRKAEREEAEAWDIPLDILYFESYDLLETLCDYCRQDVISEEGLSEALPDLSPQEQVIYLLDQVVNERGFTVDVDGVEAALFLISQETARLNSELAKVTKGAVTKATQREQLKAWLEANDLIIDNTQKGTIEDVLSDTDLKPKVRRALEILRTLGKASTAKYSAMQKYACPDAKVRGGLLYHGASTGRWTGVGVQPHNFPKGRIADIDATWQAIKTRDAETVRQKVLVKTKDGKVPVGDVMAALSEGLRGAITASPGMQLYVADYASIEARVLPWLSEDEETLEMFRTGADIYCEMAKSIYGYECNKNDHPGERALGKIAILGLGYQMGIDKFLVTCENAGIPIDYELAERTVNAFRSRFWRTKQLWQDMQDAAINATFAPRIPYTVGKVTWKRVGRFLYCTLPSGRRLAYPDPEVREKPVPWGGTRPALSYMGVDPYTRKWSRQSAYGGLLVENVDQAVSRDIMAAALLRCSESGVYTPLLTVHDELIAEAPLGQGDVKEFEHMVAALPAWAEGCPIAAEGWAGVRYRK